MTKQDTNMNDAYTAAGKVLAAQKEQNPLLAEQFLHLKELKPIVVPGQHDHIEKILNAMEIPYEMKRLIDLSTLPSIKNRPIFVNCSGIDNPQRSLTERLKDHVREGGTLITTDWALTLTNAIFPEYIAWNNLRTGGSNESFAVDMDTAEKNAPTLSWFVENSSYPLALPMHTDVRVILSSNEFGKRYGGNAALGVSFPFGKGGVVHYVSHLYAQMVKLHKDQDATASTDWAQTKSVDLGDLGAKTTTGAVSTAYDTMSSILKGGTMVWNAEAVTQQRTYKATIIPTVQTPLRPDSSFYLRGRGTFEFERLVESLAGEYTIGRCSEAELLIADSKVSRRHAQLYQAENGIQIKDLDSRNGTYVNKNAINKPTQLYFGDKIKVGGTVVEIIPAMVVS